PLCEPAGPRLELALTVVAAAELAARVEADEGEVGRQLARLERAARVVADHERRAGRAQLVVGLRHEPRLVAELEAVPARPQIGERVAEALRVLVGALEVRRELPEDRPELRRADERRDPLVEDRRVRRHVRQPLHVRDVAAHLHREAEAGRALVRPARDRVGAGQTVEGRVDLDRVEVPRVELEPAARREPRRIEDAVAPVLVVPAGAAYADAASASASCLHSSPVPAATTRERPSRSSGAAANGGASGRSIARPTSRTSSWAAAMSTERA